MRLIQDAEFYSRQLLSLTDFKAGDFTRAAIELPQRLAAASPLRQACYLAGRLAARQALQMAGESGEFTIGTDAGGCPLFPPSVVGSISHVRAGDRIEAVCLVARKERVKSLGIDLEQSMSADVAAAVIDQVCDLHEQSLLSTQQMLASDVALTLVFSAKEALFKALWPEVKQIFEFTDVALTRLVMQPPQALTAVVLPCQVVLPGQMAFPAQTQCGYCDFVLKKNLSATQIAGLSYRAQWLVSAQQVLTVLRVPALSSEP